MVPVSGGIFQDNDSSYSSYCDIDVRHLDEMRRALSSGRLISSDTELPEITVVVKSMEGILAKWLESGESSDWARSIEP